MTLEQLQAIVDYIRKTHDDIPVDDIPVFEQIALENLAEAFGFDAWELE